MGSKGANTPAVKRPAAQLSSCSEHAAKSNVRKKMNESVSEPPSASRAQPVFNAKNDPTCIAVRRMFESKLFDPSVEGSQPLSRNATVKDERGGSLDCGHLLYALRTKYREDNPSTLITSRVKALNDLPGFSDFINAKVIGKAPRALSESTLQREPVLAVLKSCSYVLENVTSQLVICDAENQLEAVRLDHAIWQALKTKQVENLVKVSPEVAEEILFHATEFLDASTKNNANSHTKK